MNYSYEVSTSNVAGGVLAVFGFIWFIMMAISIFMLICMYKVYKKAGRKGWEALIPIYNFVVMIQIAELPMWYIVLYFIPFANIYALFKIYIEFAHKFGKSTGFGILMVFFSYICFPILAFGNARYQGSMPMNNGYNPNNNMQQYSDMGMNYNQNIGMNNAVQTPNFNGINNQINTDFQAVAPVAPMSNNLENNNQPVNLEQTNMVMPSQTIEAAPMTNIDQVSDVQSIPVIETPASSVVEPVAPTSNTVSIESQSVPTENIQNNKKFCPNCGNQVDQNDAICFMCGNQF